MQNLIDRIKKMPLDLNSDEVQSICRILNEKSWAALKWEFEFPVSKMKLIELIDYVKAVPHVACRLYEVYFLNKIKNFFYKNEGSFDQLIDELRGDISLYACLSRSIYMLKGTLIYLKTKSINEASYYFLRATQDNISGSVVTPFFSYARSVNYVSTFDLKENQPKNSIDHKGLPFILCAANTRYIKLFLKNYVDSIKLENCEIGFHIHWISDNVDASDEILVENYLIEYKNRYGIFFDFSKEFTPDIKDKISYYALSRFLQAKKLINEKKQLIITDIDYQLVGDLKKFSSACFDRSVYLQINKANNFKSCFPWLRIAAGTVVVNNSYFGNKFLSDYERMIHKVFVANSTNWGIDQNILCSLESYYSASEEIESSLCFENPFVVPRELKKGTK